jgi:hypothetical protein
MFFRVRVWVDDLRAPVILSSEPIATWEAAATLRQRLLRLRGAPFFQAQIQQAIDSSRDEGITWANADNGPLD